MGKSQFFSGFTHLPTPTTTRVYANLLEGPLGSNGETEGPSLHILRTHITKF